MPRSVSLWWSGIFSESLRSMSVEERRALIEPEHGQLSIVRQCELVSISRSSFYYQPVGETSETLALMRLIDAQFLETPCVNGAPTLLRSGGVIFPSPQRVIMAAAAGRLRVGEGRKVGMARLALRNALQWLWRREATRLARLCVGSLGRAAPATRQRRVGELGCGAKAWCLLQQSGMLAHPVAGALDLHDDGVVQQPVQRGCGDPGIAENLAPFRKAAVGGEDHGAALIAGIDQLEEQVSGG